MDTGRLAEVSAQLQGLLPQIAAETSLESLRGLEGSGATAYFGVLDEMILREKETFSSTSAAAARRSTRSTRCSRLPIVWLAHDCASALESVGLDAMSASCTATGRGASRWRST